MQAKGFENQYLHNENSYLKQLQNGPHHTFLILNKWLIQKCDQKILYQMESILCPLPLSWQTASQTSEKVMGPSYTLSI